MAFLPAPEARCLDCGFPCRDHVEFHEWRRTRDILFRYWVRPYLLHQLPAHIVQIFRPVRRWRWPTTY